MGIPSQFLVVWGLMADAKCLKMDVVETKFVVVAVLTMAVDDLPIFSFRNEEVLSVLLHF